LGNINAERNVLPLVVFKHEDDGFGPKMAKRLEAILA
jgi:hypothetical protein